MRHRIYIPLAGDPGSFRPAQATALGYGQFSVLGPVSPGDRWQFMPGEIVECESRTLPDGTKALVAVSSVPPDPEVRSRRIVYGFCGAFVGALLGLWYSIWFGLSGGVLIVVAAACAVAFALSSMRWGDRAWEILSRLMRW